MTDETEQSLPLAQCHVAIIGADSAGLSNTIELNKRGIPDIIVIERQSIAGAAPRNCGHSFFGMREFKDLYSGERCSGEHNFSTGNLLWPVETAGWSRHESWQTARYTADSLNNKLPPTNCPTHFEIKIPLTKYDMPQRFPLSIKSVTTVDVYYR